MIRFSLICLICFAMIFLFMIQSRGVSGSESTDSLKEFSNPEENLRAFIKTRVSLDGQDTVIYWRGSVHASIPEKKSRKLFHFEGFNIARAVPVEGGYQVLTREAAFYCNPDTEKVIDHWVNPFTGISMSVLHVWNDPVNQELLLDGKRGPLRLPVTFLGKTVSWNLELLLSYPSPLPRSKYPLYSQSDIYQAAELFSFMTTRESLAAPSPSADCIVTWTRISPWLPWMEMGDRPGSLIYHCQGEKLPGGYAALPEWIKKRVAATAPIFSTSPESYSQPNESSWTSFRKLLVSGKVGEKSRKDMVPPK